MKLWTRWLIAGLLSIGLGILALGNATVVSIGIVWVTGSMLLLAGTVQVAVGVSDMGAGNRALSVLLGLLMVALGISFMSQPLKSVISLSALVATFIGLAGVLRLALAWSLRQTGYFWAMLISGALSILLAGYIFANFATAGEQLLGILLGIELVFNGGAISALALFLRDQSGEQ